ncbi:MFS transporter [Streptomyces sp. NBC_01187]|uniref:MFS transporter n=1 Tax=Streptomyces sp. NBC_01187 TaxID=2903766 RepID=UPI00386EEF20|nr:MFS transporter [Streptomyces sp. NBC_01187]
MTRALGQATGSSSPTTQLPADGRAFGVRLMAPLLLGSLLNPVNSTMIATALVAIGHGFGVGAADTAWLIASLYLASAVAQPTMGKLADLLGPRRVFLAGLVITLAAGVVGAAAPAFGWLIASRVLLGIGTSAAYPCAMALLRAEASRLGRPVPRPVLARLSLAALGSAATGPVLGGLLAATVGWRAIFAVNVPIALAGLALALLWLPKDARAEDARGEDARGESTVGPADPAADVTHAPDRPRRTGRGASIDALGILLFAAALTTAMLFLMELAHPRWVLLVPFAVLAAAFVRWQLRRPAPFLDLRMLARHRPLVLTYLRHGLTYLVIYCVMYGFAQWLEESHGFSSFQSGLIMLPMSLAAALCSLLGARTKGIRGPLMLTAVLLLAGAGMLAIAHGSTPLAVLLAASVLFGLPQGLAGTSNQAAVAAQAPADGVGAAAGLQRTSQYLGAITASSLIALFYGHQADDAGLHLIAVTTAVLSLALCVLTVTDRALHGRS